MPAESIYLNSLYFDQEAGIPLRGLDRALACTKTDLTSVQRIYVATILGDMEEEQRALSTQHIPMTLQHAFLDSLRNRTDAPIVQVSAACVSGCAALTLARAQLVAGAKAPLVVLAYEQCSDFLTAGFGALRCLTDDPAPYTTGRDGFRLAPGFAMASLSTMPRDDQSVLLAASVNTNDAAHLTGPDRGGRGLSQAIRAALHQAQITASDIDAIKLNGAGTTSSDAAEVAALKDVFGAHLVDIPCMCFKPSIGHTQGASGLIETILAAQALQKQQVPAASERMVADAAFPLNLSAVDRVFDMQRILLVFSGMGGQNAVLILERQP